jgi:hypothetical protein
MANPTTRAPHSIHLIGATEQHGRGVEFDAIHQTQAGNLAVAGSAASGDGRILVLLAELVHNGKVPIVDDAIQ